MPKGKYGRPATKPERQIRKRNKRQDKEDEKLRKTLKEAGMDAALMKGTSRRGIKSTPYRAEDTKNATAANARRWRDKLMKRAIAEKQRKK